MDIEKLFKLPGRGRVAFEAMQLHDQKLGFPHQNYKTIHIAGTNGKGSVATKMAAVLQHLNYRVGLYTSPHIWNYRERIQINGEMIPDQTAQNLLDETYDPALCFFDVLTAMAFLYFAREKVDYAVIETGLGGRFDATQVITPILAVITSIGFDHMAILGNTLEEIAQEKGGIAKPGIPLIAGPTAAPFFPKAIPVACEPFYEFENRSIAKRALAELGIQEGKGLEATPPCRFQKIGKILFDVAHNPQAFSRLIEGLQFHFPGKKFPFYLAFSKDKDWERCVQIAAQAACKIQMIKGSHPRLRQEYPGFEMICPQEIEEGVVAGSFYIIEEIQSKEGAFTRLSHL